MACLNYTIEISDYAKNMLSTHFRFISNVDKDAAIEKKNEILRAIKDLEFMPERYPFFEAEFIPKNKYHKLYVKKWYIILYQIKDNIVYVDYVLDCREDYYWLIN